jgi:hypothetical protein
LHSGPIQHTLLLADDQIIRMPALHGIEAARRRQGAIHD